nr:hypothetical protein [Saccharolobus solfataricus]
MADIYVVYAVTDPSSKARKSYSHLSLSYGKGNERFSCGKDK